jgi:crotonobetainyl-CoA:carnitine CoA-transferase CaiB-like acyl-CoA transferase
MPPGIVSAPATSSGPDGALAGLRVVELSERVAGAYSGKLLVDAGADVIKVEPPGGDPLRRWTASGTPLDGDGPLYHYLAAGKRSAAAELPELVAIADIIVLTATPAGAARLGVDPDVVRSANPAAVLVTISDFGWSGPWAERTATEFTLQAWCGATGFRGVPERPPVSVGGGVGEYVGGVCAAAGALAAWRRAAATGIGDHVDVSLLECMTLAMQAFEWLHVRLMDLPGFARSIEVPSIEPAKDGWVGTSMVTGQQWLDFAAMVDQPKLAEDKELRYQLGRWPRRHEVYDLIHPWFAERTVQEVVEVASLFRIPMAPLGNGASIPDMDHFVERRVFQTNPAGFRQPRPPWQIRSVSPQVPHRGSARTVRPDPHPPPRDGVGPTTDSPSLPLDGIRIVDFTAFWAGPSATHFLAALGADVVKIESIQRPDGIRFAAGPPEGTQRWWEYSWLFHGVNVDKRSVTLDLTRPEGVDLAQRLIAGADAVVENFSPRVMEAFGLGPDVLHEVNPRAVVVRMPAFGIDGPWRDRVGFAPTMEQLSGMAWMTGYADGAPMAPRGACDPLSGIHAAFALIAALEQRDRTGEGTLIELPMIEVALNVTAEQVIEHDAHGIVLERDGNRGPAAAPQNVYACTGDEQWVALAVATDEQWVALRRVLGDPVWAADPSLATHRGRRAAHDLLDRELSAWFATRRRDDVVEQLGDAGIPVAPVVLPPDVVDNAQLRARGFFETLDHPYTGPTEYAGLPFARLRGVDRWCRRPAPALGQHNDEVLGGELGLTPEELARLRVAQVIGDRPAGL